MGLNVEGQSTWLEEKLCEEGRKPKSDIVESKDVTELKFSVASDKSSSHESTDFALSEFEDKDASHLR